MAGTMKPILNPNASKRSSTAPGKSQRSYFASTCSWTEPFIVPGLIDGIPVSSQNIPPASISVLSISLIITHRRGIFSFLRTPFRSILTRHSIWEYFDSWTIRFQASDNELPLLLVLVLSFFDSFSVTLLALLLLIVCLVDWPVSISLAACLVDWLVSISSSLHVGRRDGH